MTLEQSADQGRERFRNKAYGEAETMLLSCAAEQTVNQPLYKCELASVALLQGDKEKAQAHLDRAVHLLEGFYDAKSEKQAASLWGQESKKVYKGDPYERATLYMFYGMSLLEKGEVDNALASFKRALLMDGDTEKSTYQSDFGLVQFLAAKCHDLRGEAEQRDTMLRMAADSYLSYPGVSNGFSHSLLQEYETTKALGSLDTSPPSAMLANLYFWAGPERIAKQLGFSADLQGWMAKHPPKNHGLEFNTLLVGWVGHGPTMSRAGEYGEKRIIHPGYRTGYFCEAFSCCAKPGAPFIDGYPWLGNISYQATTRGGRRMDNVLERAKNIKNATSVTGDAMMVGGLTGLGSDSSSTDPVFAGVAVAGVLVKVIAATMTAEADIRCWQCLPHELMVLPLNLSEGESHVPVTSWGFSFPRAITDVTVKRKTESPVTFAHFAVPSADAGTDFLPGFYDKTASQSKICMMAILLPEIADPDQDGELSAKARKQLLAEMKNRYDADGDGVLNDNETARLVTDANAKLMKRMGN